MGAAPAHDGARRAASSASCIVVAGILPSNRAAGEGSGVAIAAGVGSAGMKRLGHCFAQKPSQFSSRMAAQMSGCLREKRASQRPAVSAHCALPHAAGHQSSSSGSKAAGGPSARRPSATGRRTSSRAASRPPA